MTTTTTIIKDADETITYTIDCSDSLPSGETISSVVVTSSPSGLTIGSPAISSDGTQFNIRIGGGTTDVIYSLDVIVNVTSNNILNLCLTLAIRSACWMTEMVMMLRGWIGDMSDTPTYSDSRLRQMLLIAAQFVQIDLQWPTTYTINISESSISPDPADEDTRDVDFMNFVVLKASCMADLSTYRTKALMEGIRANLGPASLTVGGNAKGFMDLLNSAEGPCGLYKGLRRQYQFGNVNMLRAVMNMFSSNQFNPSDNGQNYYNEREGYR
jgi:hypothetical protein